MADPVPVWHTEATGRLEYILGRCLALPGLILLSFGALYDVNPSNAGMALLLLATVMVIPACWRTLSREPLVWLVVGSCLWLLILGWSNASTNPEWSYEIWNVTGDWLLTPFLGTLVAAFWLARFPRLWGWLLALLVAGYVVRVLTEISPEMTRSLLEGTERATFGDSANNFGLWSLVCVLLALGFPLARFGHDAPLLRVTARAVWLFVLVLSLAGVVLAQTRGVWLAAPFGIAVTVYGWLSNWYPGRSSGRLIAAAIAASILALSILGAVFGSLVVQRMSEEADTVADVASGRLENLPNDSVGYRIRQYRDGLETWIESPLLGNGPATPMIVLDTSDDTEIRRFNDFHNLYLDVLASFGLVGLMALGVYLAMAFRTVRTAVRSGWMSPRIGQFLAAVTLAFAVTQLFSSSLHSYRGPFVVALLAGMAYAWRFAAFRCNGENSLRARLEE